MSDFRIEKGVPPPAGKRKYPWLEMETGDSFLVPNVAHTTVAAMASTQGKRDGRKYQTSAVEGGIRVWRIK